MTPLISRLSALGILDAQRLTQFHPHVRDRDDIAVLRDPLTEVIVLSRSDHMTVSYYETKPERAEHIVDGRTMVTPPLEDDIRRGQEFSTLLRNRHWLDFGCGLGGVLDVLKGQTRWAAGPEPSRERAAIAASKGHLILDSLHAVQPGLLDVVTLSHVLEHLTHPIETLREISTRLRAGGTVLIEVPHARDALFTLYDSEPFKAFTFWSEHLVLHTRQSLKSLLEAAGFEDVEIRGKQRYPLSNHLHWLARQQPGGHESWACLNSTLLHEAYEAALSGIDRTDTLIATARTPKARL